MNLFAATGLLWLSVVVVARYKTFSAMNAVLFTDVLPEAKAKENEHSEYFFGKCLTKAKQLLAHETYEYADIINQIVVRGSLFDLTPETIPTCVQIKATSDQGDMIRYNAYKFTVCVIRFTFQYNSNSGGNRSDYFYYEWFVPVQMQKHVTWDLYFYLA